MSVPHSRPSRVKIWLLGCLLTSVGVFFSQLLRSSTAEFRGLGASNFIIFGMPQVVVSVLGGTVVFFVAGWVEEKCSLPIAARRSILLSPWLLIAAFWITSGVISATPGGRFASHVVQPVPSSVQDIKAAGLSSFLARRWLFSFSIDTAQIIDIVARRDLTQTNSFDFQKLVAGDTFLKRVVWAQDVGYDSNALYYARLATNQSSHWTFLVVNTNSARAWFFSGYQN